MNLRAARESITATLTALALADVTVFGYEPAALPRGITVTVASVGVEDVEWLLVVRVYVNGMQTAEAQDVLDDTVVQVDAALVVPARSPWTLAWDGNRNVFVATITVLFPREDF